MKTKLTLVLFGLLFNFKLAAAEIAVFVSFSMPEQLLQETLSEASRLHFPVYLNGLYHNSMQETAIKLLRLSQQIPNLSLQIDPTRFERFAISQVPALVVARGKAFDVLYGHLSLREGLLRIADKGGCGFTQDEARRINDV